MPRMLSVFSAAALALTGAVVFGATSASAASVADITPPEEGGSVIVHKHAGKPGPAGDGTEITDPAKVAALGIGLDGVKFKIERVSYDGVPIDLSTSAGWDLVPESIAEMNADPDYTKVQIGDEQTTAGGGIATFSELDLGLYVVTETVPPAGATPSPAFLVTVPLPHPTENTWIYNVHVYPKNLLPDDKKKEVTDPALQLQGEPVTWTLTVPVVAPTEGTTYTKFLVTDALDDRLEYVPGSLSVMKDGSPLAPAGNYTVSEPDPEDDNTLVVTFDPTKLLTGQVLVLSFDTNVNGLGEIVNSAYRNVNDNVTKVGTEQVNYGNVKVVKYREGSRLTLQGAMFELWDGEQETKLYGPVGTDANGEITFSGVGLGKGSDKSEELCLKETAPPPGYSYIDEWTCFTLTVNESGETKVVTYRADIYNEPRETPPLPLTGDAGTTLFMAGGLGLLVLAVGAGLLASRRRDRSTDLS